MAATDTYPRYDAKVEFPAVDGFAVTPHASNELSFVTRAVYVGTGGSLVVLMSGGTELTFANVPDGSLLPLRVKAVRATSTATNIIGLI